MMWKWLVCSKTKTMKTQSAGTFQEKSHWFLIVMMSIIWPSFLFYIYNCISITCIAVALSYLSQNQGLLEHSSRRHIPCADEMRAGWLPQFCRWGPQIKSQQELGYLSWALTWSLAGLVKPEHFSTSMGMSMWPQLWTQGLGFTSWTEYNNRMLGYLGCIHCREYFFFISRKKKSVSL